MSELEACMRKQWGQILSEHLGAASFAKLMLGSVTLYVDNGGAGNICVSAITQFGNITRDKANFVTFNFRYGPVVLDLPSVVPDPEANQLACTLGGATIRILCLHYRISDKTWFARFEIRGGEDIEMGPNHLRVEVTPFFG